MNLSDYEIVNSPSEFVKEKMISYILSRADRVEFLVENEIEMPVWYYFDDEVKKLFKDNFILASENKAYCMKGVCYLFKMTDEIRNYFIERNDISSAIKSVVDDCICFDNPTFYDGEKCIISNCSHENMVDIYEPYKKELKDEYLKFAQSDPVYFEIYQNFKSCETKNIEREYNILNSLKLYINDGVLAFLINSNKIECSYSDYLVLVNKYFSKELAVHFNKATFFGGLYFNNFKRRFETEMHYLRIIAGVDDNIIFIG